MRGRGFILSVVILNIMSVLQQNLHIYTCMSVITFANPAGNWEEMYRDVSLRFR
jgi:hypothetical protein